MSARAAVAAIAFCAVAARLLAGADAKLQDPHAVRRPKARRAFLT